MSLVEDMSLVAGVGNSSARKSDIVTEINKEDKNEKIPTEEEKGQDIVLCDMCGEAEAKYYLPLGYNSPSLNLCKSCFEDLLTAFFWGYGFCF
jgi:hypothetical protein